MRFVANLLPFSAGWSGRVSQMSQAPRFPEGTTRQVRRGRPSAGDHRAHPRPYLTGRFRRSERKYVAPH